MNDSEAMNADLEALKKITGRDDIDIDQYSNPFRAWIVGGHGYISRRCDSKQELYRTVANMRTVAELMQHG